MITVKVGPEEVIFHAPKDVLCRSSTFFKTALSKDWSENKERCVRLPEDDSDIFTTYLQYAFTQRVVAIEEKPEDANMETHYSKLFALYCFADRIDDKACKNVIMDRIIHLHSQRKTAPSDADIYKVFESTMDDCMLQRYLVDVAVHCPMTRDLKANDVVRCPVYYCKVITMWAALRDAGVHVKRGLPTANHKKSYYHEDLTEPADESNQTASGSAEPAEDTTDAAGGS